MVVGDDEVEAELPVSSGYPEVAVFANPPLKPNTNYTLFVVVASTLHANGILFAKEDKDFLVLPKWTMVVQTAPLAVGWLTEAAGAAIGAVGALVLAILSLLGLWWMFLRHRSTFWWKVGVIYRLMCWIFAILYLLFAIRFFRWVCRSLSVHPLIQLHEPASHTHSSLHLRVFLLFRPIL